MKQVNRNGIVFNVVSDTPDSTFWDLHGWESENYDILHQQSVNHKVFVHAGGWIGPFTLFAAKLYEKVFCLEPDTIAYNELKRNIDLNGYNNIVLENKAFLDTETTLSIGSDYSELGRSGTSMFQNEHSIEVATVTLKQFFNQYHISEKCMLMLDVEGAEYCLFSDFDFFKQYKPTILVSFHLTFLTDENYNILYNSLEKLSELYNVDLDRISSERAISPYQAPFRGFDLLLTLKDNN